MKKTLQAPPPQLDVTRFYAALDLRRKTANLSWRQLASDAGVSPSTLTRLGQGKRPDVDGFAALVNWLGVPPGRFLGGTAGAERTTKDLVSVVSGHLRASKNLTPEGAKALEEIFRAAYEHLKDAKKR